MKKFIQTILIRKTFKKYRNSLPEKSKLTIPKMEYHALADAVFWNDEGLTTCHPDLENAFRFVIYYRTCLLTGSKDIEDKRKFDLAKKYFPNWIGFQDERCSSNPELSDRIKRIRDVSNWRLNKLLNQEANSSNS